MTTTVTIGIIAIIITITDVLICCRWQTVRLLGKVSKGHEDVSFKRWKIMNKDTFVKKKIAIYLKLFYTKVLNS